MGKPVAQRVEFSYRVCYILGKLAKLSEHCYSTWELCECLGAADNPLYHLLPRLAPFKQYGPKHFLDCFLYESVSH